GYDSSESYTYDPIGNLKSKGAASYTYGAPCAAGPHAVCTIGTSAPYAYDLNGNMTSGAGRQVQFTPSNKVDSIASATRVVDFVYGPEGDRILQRPAPAGAQSAETVTTYVGLGNTG